MYGPPPRTYSASPCAGTGAARTHERTRRRSLLLWSIHDAPMPGACVMPVLQLLGQLGSPTLRVLSVHAPHYVHNTCTLHAQHAHCTHTARTLHARDAAPQPIGLPSASAGLELPLATTTHLLHSSASWGSSCSRQRTTAPASPRKRGWRGWRARPVRCRSPLGTRAVVGVVGVSGCVGQLDTRSACFPTRRR